MVKSTSNLPLNPEVSSRNGIRHFNHDPSIPNANSQSISGNRKRLRTKRRPIMGRMTWLNLFNRLYLGDRTKNLTPQHGQSQSQFPKTLEEMRRAIAREESVVNELEGMRQQRDNIRMIQRIPVKGKGVMMFAESQPQTNATAPEIPLQYPYPENIPPAAAQQTMTNYQVPLYHSDPSSYVAPQPVPDAQAPQPHGVAISMEMIVAIAVGICVSITAYFVYVFRYELIKYGGFAAFVFLIWKLSQWNTQATFAYREQEWTQQRRFASPTTPQSQPQRYVFENAPPVPQGYPAKWHEDDSVTSRIR